MSCYVAQLRQLWQPRSHATNARGAEASSSVVFEHRERSLPVDLQADLGPMVPLVWLRYRERCIVGSTPF